MTVFRQTRHFPNIWRLWAHGSNANPFIFVYATADTYGIMKGQRIWLPLLQSKVFPFRIVKIYEFADFGERSFLEQWLAYQRRRRWTGPTAPQIIHNYLEMISPSGSASRIPNYMAELEVLRRITLTICNADLPPAPHPSLNTAERKVLHAFRNAAPADKAELWSLKAIQATELRSWILGLPPATYRTSDLTAQFNTHIQSHSASLAPLQEVGSLMKMIGYENKRTAAGYIWPQLAPSGTKPQHAPIKPADLDVGSAGLFNGL